MLKSRVAGLGRRLHIWFVLWAALLWVLLHGEFSLANVVSGFVVGLVVVLVLPLPALPTANMHINIGPLLRLLLLWIVDLFRGATYVAWLSLRPRPLPNTAILVVPMRVESELVLALGTILYNLQPGGTITDIDVACRRWTIHILDAHSDKAIERQRQLVATLEQRLIHAFERRV